MRHSEGRFRAGFHELAVAIRRLWVMYGLQNKRAQTHHVEFVQCPKESSKFWPESLSPLLVGHFCGKLPYYKQRLPELEADHPKGCKTPIH